MKLYRFLSIAFLILYGSCTPTAKVKTTDLNAAEDLEEPEPDSSEDGDNTSNTPKISMIATLAMDEDTPAGPLAVSVTNAGGTSCKAVLLARSSNTALLPMSGISITGTIPNCSLTLTPAANAHGRSIITLSIAEKGKKTSKSLTFVVNPVDDAPVSQAVNPAALIQNVETTVNLVYSDAEGHLASSCALSLLSHISVSTACSCDGVGACSVGIRGNNGYAGPASFQYTVTANSLNSQATLVSLTILPDLFDNSLDNAGFLNAGFANTEWNVADEQVQMQTWTDDMVEFQIDGSDDFDMTGLVGYWRFKGTTGQPVAGANDAVSSLAAGNHHGTAVGGPSHVAGRIKAGIEFDGVDDYVAVASSDDFDLSAGSLTISLWAKPDNINQSTPIFYRLLNLAPYTGYYLKLDDNGAGKKLVASLMEVDGVNFRRANTLEDFVDGGWHHLVMVADKIADRIYVYVDGKKAAASYAALGGWPEVDIAQDLYFAERWGWDFYKGALDEIMMFKRALSASEIDKLYNRQAGRFGGGASGVYTSRVFDSGKANAEWNHFNWVAAGPYHKALPEANASVPYYDATNLEVFSENPADAVLMNGIIGYWPLNGNGAISNGNTVLDFSGKSHSLIATEGGALALSF